MVRIYCRTYNHEKYIIDALNGFADQQTNFPFVATIVEDCSKDNTAKLIQQYVENYFDLDDSSVAYKKETEYAKITYAQHKTNKNCFFAVLLLNYNHHQLRKSVFPYIEEWTNNSKYFIVNEGDDFFCDSLKLQKQVDFLEANPNCSVCTHASKLLYPDNSIEVVHSYDQDLKICPTQDIIITKKGFLNTNSMLNRYFTPPESRPDWLRDCPISDIATKLYLLSKGDFGYIDEVLSCYRMNSEGSWSVRQSQSFKKTIKHHVAMWKFWRRYDKITLKKHHNIIKAKIKSNNTALIKSVPFLILGIIKGKASMIH